MPVSKLPSSRTIGWCGAGGFTFGVMLKDAGFDHVIMKVGPGAGVSQNLR
jgi:aldehyde:ferredoxin oxidoreductase